ncbi:hypothetical protein H0H93_003574, partial [Arthromyces matolae]
LPHSKDIFLGYLHFALETSSGLWCRCCFRRKLSNSITHSQNSPYPISGSKRPPSNVCSPYHVLFYPSCSSPCQLLCRLRHPGRFMGKWLHRTMEPSDTLARRTRKSDGSYQ